MFRENERGCQVSERPNTGEKKKDQKARQCSKPEPTLVEACQKQSNKQKTLQDNFPRVKNMIFQVESFYQVISTRVERYLHCSGLYKGSHDRKMLLDNVKGSAVSLCAKDSRNHHVGMALQSRMHITLSIRVPQCQLPPKLFWGHTAADASACGGEVSPDLRSTCIFWVFFCPSDLQRLITYCPLAGFECTKARPRLWVHREARCGRHFLGVLATPSL